MMYLPEIDTTVTYREMGKKGNVLIWKSSNNHQDFTVLQEKGKHGVGQPSLPVPASDDSATVLKMKHVIFDFATYPFKESPNITMITGKI
eukprot:g7273.t1